MRMIIGLFLAVAVATSASAACGGGGWRAADSKPGVAGSNHRSSTAKASSTHSAIDTSYVRPTATATGAPVAVDLAFDSHFAAVSPKLNLSAHQYEEVSEVRSDVQNQIRKLQEKQRNAQAKLDRCSGNCASETRKLSQATEDLHRFNAQVEFERKLLRVLNSNQTHAYLSSK